MSVDERASRDAKMIWDFAKDFLVVCPRCQRRAIIKRGKAPKATRLSCGACVYVRDWVGPCKGYQTGMQPGVQQAGVVIIGAPIDPYLHADLWLQVACVGETLWAYNAEHVGFLRGYVGARLRERPTDGNVHGLRNQLLESRLPKWMTLAKNRDAVLAGVAKLEQRLLQDGTRSSVVIARRIGEHARR